MEDHPFTKRRRVQCNAGMSLSVNRLGKFDVRELEGDVASQLTVLFYHGDIGDIVCTVDMCDVPFGGNVLNLLVFVVEKINQGINSS